jgi:hypothetical protein
MLNGFQGCWLQSRIAASERLRTSEVNVERPERAWRQDERRGGP